MNAQGNGGHPSSAPLFRLGQVVATPGALEALQEAGQQPQRRIWKQLSRRQALGYTAAMRRRMLGRIFCGCDDRQPRRFPLLPERFHGE